MASGGRDTPDTSVDDSSGVGTPASPMSSRASSTVPDELPDWKEYFNEEELAVCSMWAVDERLCIGR